MTAASGLGRDGWRMLRRQQRVERMNRAGHWYLGPCGRAVRWSRGAARLHGFANSPSRVSLGVLLGTLAEPDGAALAAALGAAAAGGGTFEIDVALAPAAGARTLCLVGRPQGAAAPGRAGVLVAVRDVTDLRATETRLRKAEAWTEGFFTSISDWPWELDADLRFSFISPRVEEASGVPAAFYIGKTRRDLIRPEDVTEEVEEHFAALDRHEPFSEVRYWRTGPDGRRQCVATSGRPVFEEGVFAGYRGLARDVTDEEVARENLLRANRELTEEKRRADEAAADLRRANALLARRHAEMAGAQSVIRHAALHDALTGLPNRRHLDEALAAHAGLPEGDRGLVGLLHLGLDRFRQINDTLGHAAGDAVLCHVAGLLSRHALSGDLVARVGGDEFALVCAGRTGEPELEALARALSAELARPFLHDGRECWIGASIGIATARGPDIRPAELQINADIALHRAKQQGRGRHCVFSSDLQSEIVRYKSRADGMLAGMKRGEFTPWYQPQICAATWRIAGVEALARWRHPSDGVLPPHAFLGIADDLGVVDRLDRTILEAAAADLLSWREAGLDVPRMSVNVSARRLMDRDLIAGVAEMGLPRGLLAFELLETAFLDDLDDAVAWNIDMLKEIGIDIELDDFGSGHASILSLVKLGPDAIKIDRQLVTSIAESRRRRGLVRSIIDIGRALDTRVIAEGVETPTQVRMLHEMGCDSMQGYYFARPMPAPAFIAFVEEWERGMAPRAAQA